MAVIAGFGIFLAMLAMYAPPLAFCNPVSLGLFFIAIFMKTLFG